MRIRKKVGILLILIGIGIPIVLYFFQDDGMMWTIKTHKQIQRNLDPDEVNALREISFIKKEIAKIEPYYDIPYIKPELNKEFNGEWIRSIGDEEFGKSISFKEYANKIIQYETKFTEAIKTAYANDHFVNEAWDIDIRKQIDIPYRQVVGIGVFLVLAGIGFLIFSIFTRQT